MTLLDYFRAVADHVGEPMLLVSVDGRIRAANAASRRAFDASPGALAGRHLADCATTAADAIGDYLRRCARSGDSLPGALTLRAANGGEPTVWRSEGARWRIDSGDEPLVVLRLMPKESAIAQFVGLTEKVGNLSAEVRRRRLAERAAADALERQRRVQDRLTALTEGSKTLVSSLALTEVLPAIGALTERLIPADAHAVWHFERDARQWRAVWQRGLSEEFITEIGNWTGREQSAAAPLVEPLFVSDIHKVPLLVDRRATYEAEGVRSLLIIPLRIGAESYGTTVAYYRRQMSIDDDDQLVATALGNLGSSALTMSALYDAEARNRIAAEISERRAEFLAKASEALSSSLDYEETLATVARLAVPEIADWCVVEIRTERSELKRLAIAHVDPAKIRFVEDLQAQYPPDPESRYGSAEAARTLKPILMRRIPPEVLVSATRDATHLEMVRALGLRSYMCIPLVWRKRAIGVLTLVQAESGREYTEADLRVAEAVASRAALAVENARAYEQARRANRLKDEFLATLSHELRTPLNAVLGYTRMLRAGILPGAKRAHAVEVIDRNATALNQIVEDVLDVSRIVAGKIRLNVQPLDISIVAHDAAATVRPAADAKGVRFDVKLAPLDASVLGDRDRLQQVVWNLLSNAIKFTPPGGRVQLSLNETDEHVEIVVTDTGVGISAEFLPHLFERFRQADSRFAREHGGLGLGLAIARDIVELHGGTIEAFSEGDQRGATLRVRLPVVRDEPVASDRAPAVTADEASWERAIVGQLDGIHVIAVDDDADALALVAEVLRAAGAHVSTAPSASDALALLARLPRADVLVSDIGMPGMDGLELIAAIRTSADESRHIPAIALTAYARSEDRVRALKTGYQMHVAKPIDPPAIVAAVRNVATRGRTAERSV